MKIIICDACKKQTAPSQLKYAEMFGIVIEEQTNTLKYWLGKKRKVELCGECIKKIFV